MDKSTSQHKFLHGNQSAVELLKIAFEDPLNSFIPRKSGDMINQNAGSNNDLSNFPFRTLNFRNLVPLALYFPSSDGDELLRSTFDSNEMTRGSNALHAFMAYFVYMTNNNLLNSYQVGKGSELISRNFEPIFLPFLLGLNSVSMRIFTRKIFPSIVDSGNIRMVKAIIDSGIDIFKYSHTSSDAFPERGCMSIAVSNGDQKMVELLCEEGFSPQIKNWNGRKSPWNFENLDILRTLLLFGADPECFVVDRPRGFPLVDAARSGKLEAVDMLLTEGANVNSYDPKHHGTALQAAIFSNNLEIAELLIDRGADVNVPYRIPTRFAFDEKGMPQYTPFEIAVHQNNISTAQLLINNGANVDTCVPNPNENPPLRVNCPLRSAVKNRNAALARFIILKGSNVDCRGHLSCGDTPLQMAARRDYPEMVNFLLWHGADVNAAPATLNGRTAIQAAAESGSIEILRMLLEKGADVNAPAGHERGLTALQAAIMNRHPLMAGALYAAGADLNAPPGNHRGFTATQAAARARDLDLLKNLIDWGAEINGPTAKKYGLTVMEAAMLSKNMSILELLVKSGAKINAISTGNNASRCLAIAACKEWLDGARYLLKIGANLDGYWECQDPYKVFNALGWSVYFHDITMMTLLLDNGADVYSPVSEGYGQNGKCALSLGLAEASSPEIILLLLSRSKDLEKVCRKEDILACAIYDEVEDSQIFKIILNAINGLPKDVYDDQIQKAWNILPIYSPFATEELIEFMEILLESGVDINSEDDYKRTALDRALETEHTYISKYLVEKGAKINTPAVDDIGTPLQEAIRNEETELVSILLERGADINAAPAEIRGTTALQAASINGLTGLVIDLLRRGASVAAPAALKLGRTAINGAAERGRHDIIQLLLNHYDGDEGLPVVCAEAATYAEKEGHVEVAEWLRQYPIV